jgi:hypothetical protein
VSAHRSLLLATSFGLAAGLPTYLALEARHLLPEALDPLPWPIAMMTAGAVVTLLFFYRGTLRSGRLALAESVGLVTLLASASFVWMVRLGQPVPSRPQPPPRVAIIPAPPPAPVPPPAAAQALEGTQTAAITVQVESKPKPKAKSKLKANKRKRNLCSRQSTKGNRCLTTRPARGQHPRIRALSRLQEAIARTLSKPAPSPRALRPPVPRPESYRAERSDFR